MPLVPTISSPRKEKAPFAHGALSASVEDRTRNAHYPNWDSAFTMYGPRVAPQGAFSLIANLQSAFDLE